MEGRERELDIEFVLEIAPREKAPKTRSRRDRVAITNAQQQVLNSYRVVVADCRDQL